MRPHIHIGIEEGVCLHGKVDEGRVLHGWLLNKLDYFRAGNVKDVSFLLLRSLKLRRFFVSILELLSPPVGFKESVDDLSLHRSV